MSLLNHQRLRGEEKVTFYITEQTEIHADAWNMTFMFFNGSYICFFSSVTFRLSLDVNYIRVITLTTDSVCLHQIKMMQQQQLSAHHSEGITGCSSFTPVNCGLTGGNRKSRWNKLVEL